MTALQLYQMTGADLDWKTFAAWLDTEGSITSMVTKMRNGDRVGSRRSHELAIYQDEKEVLETLRDFLIRSGISRSYLYQHQGTGVWALKIYRPEDITSIISKAEPFLLTQKKKSQVERFRRFRSERYKRFPKVNH